MQRKNHKKSETEHNTIRCQRKIALGCQYPTPIINGNEHTKINMRVPRHQDNAIRGSNPKLFCTVPYWNLTKGTVMIGVSVIRIRILSVKSLRGNKLIANR
jgi:hypothetical protein